MLDSTFVTKLKKIGIYVLIFTLLFALFFYTLRYTLPFVLGFIIALSTKKINDFMQRKLKISSGLSSIITTTIVFSIIISVVTLIISKVTAEIIILLYKIPSIEKISIYIDALIKKITEIIGQIDPVVLSKIYEYLQTIISRLLNFAITILNAALSAALSLPAVLLIAVITFIATYLFSKDIKMFSNSFYSIFSSEGKSKMRTMISSAISMTIGYAKAYTLVVFITMLQVLAGLSILKIEFALIISILCAIFDMLPIIGMIMIFIPLIAYNFILGKTFVGVGLIVLFVIVQVVRQIVEPKIVSHTLDLHPILILAAIFIGLKVSGFLGMIYFIALMVGYKVLVKVNVI